MGINWSGIGASALLRPIGVGVLFGFAFMFVKRTHPKSLEAVKDKLRLVACKEEPKFKRTSEGMGLPETLAEEHVQTIVATAPVVAPKALDITKCFYGKALTAAPQLLAYFNPVHNVPISLHQPKALAASIVAYASNITDLTPLLVPGGPVDAICHRHCALTIIPEQYVLVHQVLMQAIGEVLGSAVTPPVAEAWSQAVLFLAKAFIDKEESLYQMAEKRQGGWIGLEKFEVSEIVELTDNVKRFSFKPPRGSKLAGKKFDFTPGQYLSLKIDPEGNGLTAPRHYTVTSPRGVDYLQCSIKKISGGKCSTYVHEKLRVGDTVQLAAPFGVFTADKQDPEEGAVLFSAGIGVTPMVNFSRTLGKQVKLVVHVDKSPETFPWRNHFKNAGHPMLEKYTKESGRVPVASLVREAIQRAGADNNFYVCGPEAWMNEVQAELMKQGAKRVMCEVFGSQLATGCPFMQGAPLCPFAMGKATDTPTTAGSSP